MSRYLLSTGDGLEHIVDILSEDSESYSVETIHRFRQYEIINHCLYNKCLFEKLLNLGIIQQI